MGKLKAKDLKAKNREELLKQIEDLKNELTQLRVAKVTGGTPAKLARIREVRKSIARCWTVWNDNRRTSTKVDWKGKKHKPLDLRPTLTRAQRRRLTPSQEAKLTMGERKRLKHYPLLKYSVQL